MSRKCFLLAVVVGVVGCGCMASTMDGSTKRATRLELLAPVSDGELRIRPTFTSCGVCWGAKEELPGLRLEWRRKGAQKWVATPEFPRFFDTKDYRASILDLEEDADYELRIVSADGTMLASSPFRTWKSDIPIARTVEIDPDTATFPIRLSGQGRADGWIRYTVKGGRPLVNGSTNGTLVVSGARNVVIDDIVFRGGRSVAVVKVERSTGVRIRRCEFSDFGRDTHEDFFKHGFGILWPAFGWKGYDTAIRIDRGAKEIVVERCYFHDPRYPTSPWLYSHPTGPNAIYMCRPDHSTVVRWNDFVGSDEIRWNDAIEGAGNFEADGGFNRDADIYGNFMIFSNDDGIELDGGNQNVRCFANRFERELCGVSVQGTMASPTYVYGNLIVDMTEEFGLIGVFIKGGVDLARVGTVINIFNNTFLGPGKPVNVEDAKETCRFRVYGNRASGDSCTSGESNARLSIVRDNESSVKDGLSLPFAKIPARPVPYFLSVGRIDGVRMERGVVTPTARTVRLVCVGEGYRQPFTIRQNATCNWFEVSPSHGIVESGKEIEFTVRFISERMAGRHYRRGAFLVRTADGFSRPCSVYAETDFVPPFRCERQGDLVAYANLTNGVVPLVAGKWIECAADLPADGRYAMMVRGFGSTQHPKIQVSLDNGKAEESPLMCVERHPIWTLVTPGKLSWRPRAFGMELKKGRHVVRLRLVEGEYNLGGLVFTSSPKAFEQR